MEKNVKSVSKIDSEAIVIEVSDVDNMQVVKGNQFNKGEHGGYELKYRDLNTKEYLYRMRDSRRDLKQGNVYTMKSIYGEDYEGQPGDVITFNESGVMVHIRDKDLECDFEYISEL